jgi:hypothetical protein
MDSFVTFDKIKVVVHDLLTTEVWKSKIFPLIKHAIASNTGSVKGYMSIYHEASVLNLLEVMLYHRTACESSEDSIVELIDYCYRKFLFLQHNAEKFKKVMTKTP